MANEPKGEPKELDPFGRPIDHFGIGMLADGTLNVVPPVELKARIAARDRWERGVLAIPDFQTLMLPVLRSAAAGEVRISDVVEKLADEFYLTAEERSHLLPSGKQTTFANRVHWAKSYLGKAGLVELTKRAHFRITDKGREVLAAPPERIDVKFLSRFPSFQKFREVSSDAENGDVAPSRAADISPTLTPDEVMRDAHRELNEALADELINASGPAAPLFSKAWWCACWLRWAMAVRLATSARRWWGAPAMAVWMASSTKTRLVLTASMCRPNAMPTAIQLARVPFVIFSAALTASKQPRACLSQPQAFRNQHAILRDN